MVTKCNAQGAPVQEFDNVREWNRGFVEFENNGYLGKQYANIEAGEYFDDSDNLRSTEGET